MTRTGEDLKGIADELWPAGGRTVEFTINLPPVPCPRPRVSRWGTYYPKTYQQWVNAAYPYVPEIYPVLKGKLVLAHLSVIAPPKTVVREYPRGDTDNYLKSVMDLVTKTKRLWKDDENVVAILTGKRFLQAGEEPHSYLYIKEVG